MRWLFALFFAVACTGTGQIKIKDDTADTDPCHLDPDCTSAYPDTMVGQDTPVNQKWYPDGDLDGFGSNLFAATISPTKPDGQWASVRGDCDDARSDINPDMLETCDGEDDNCNGMIDDGLTECHPGDSPPDDSGHSDSVSDTSAETDVPETDPPLETDIVPDTDDPPPDTDPLDTDIPDDTDPVLPDDSGHSDSVPDTSAETDVPETDPPLETDIVPDTDNPPPDTDQLDTDIPDDTDPVLSDDSGDSGDSASDSGDSADSADSVLETDLPPETDVPEDTAPIFSPVDTSYTDTSVDSDIWVDDTTDTAPPVIYRNYYRDNDGDGQGAGEPVPAATPPLRHVLNDHDCDDDNPDIYQGAPEVCNGLDDDCDGRPDDGLRLFRYYVDGDGDGYGDPEHEVQACGQPLGAVESSSDCNDGDALVYPGADEVCNGYDDDCDGYADTDALDAFLVYYDGDGDGQGSEDDDGRLTCSLEVGDSLVATDCDDSDPFTFEAGVALDVCGDGLDQNCDGNPDNDPVAALNWYTDYDSDGYGGSTGTTTTSCGLPAFPNTARVLGDCNDGNPSVNPGAQEVCDDLDLDEDCDGQADDDDSSVDPQSLRVFYLDLDGDGYGGPTTELACDAIGSLYPDADDCDDGSVDYSPDAYEWDDAADWNCDGSPWQESISTTATGQVVQWVESWRGLGGDVPSSLNWSGTGPQPINFGFDVLGAGASLPPGQTPWMIVGAPSAGAGHNCARRTYSVVPAGEWAIGIVHQFTGGGLSKPVVWWDGRVISSGRQHAQGQPTVFQAYGPVTGDGGPHVLDICEEFNWNGLQVAIAGAYPVVPRVR